MGEDIPATLPEAMRRLGISEANLREVFHLGELLNMTEGGTAMRDFLASYQRGMFRRALGLEAFGPHVTPGAGP